VLTASSACGSLIEHKLASSKAAATLSVNRPRRSDASASSSIERLIARARRRAAVIGDGYLTVRYEGASAAEIRRKVTHTLREILHSAAIRPLFVVAVIEAVIALLFR
jgi:hypothetical protein